ncbi:XdhC family protein [Zhouia amylolytica]|uniref:XdhC family protein n=1 Tax=Zhouia amylolytica TaxID=376730 RepID=UPI0020CD00D9|nr:XdhC/CoxI family protein [Zhouia amylolytica]MCQ0110017.1 XdhC family protein [Zhouia amylolytica]
MTHEFLQLVKIARNKKENGIKCVLASVVHLEGSSYRKPGVRMLIDEHGNFTGAVSGGCVEKEICRRAQSVFQSNRSKVITYDGRYRLGCEGVLYILIEPFDVSKSFYFEFLIQMEARNSFQITSYFKRQEEEITGDFGSVLSFSDQQSFKFSKEQISISDNDLFKQSFKPRFKLLILGAEHDAVKLCTMASLLGWEVTVVSSIKDPKSISDFPGATRVLAENPEMIDLTDLDMQTAVVLMNHNYVTDLQYLIKLHAKEFCYLGMLGSFKRWEQLQHELLNYIPDISFSFLEKVCSPAGLNIGSETPEEIAISILSEILSVTRNKESYSLKKLKSNQISKID